MLIVYVELYQKWVFLPFCRKSKVEASIMGNGLIAYFGLVWFIFY